MRGFLEEVGLSIGLGLMGLVWGIFCTVAFFFWLVERALNAVKTLWNNT